jgi:hypothetical protein
MGVLAEFFFWSLGWSCFTALSTTWLLYGVSRALSTEKGKALITVEKPVDKRRACTVCGAHEWHYVEDEE